MKWWIRIIAVVDEDGTFAGVITPETIRELMMLHSLRPDAERPLWR